MLLCSHLPACHTRASINSSIFSDYHVMLCERPCQQYRKANHKDTQKVAAQGTDSSRRAAAHRLPLAGAFFTGAFFFDRRSASSSESLIFPFALFCSNRFLSALFHDMSTKNSGSEQRDLHFAALRSSSSQSSPIKYDVKKCVP
jgi:hypothetical protein